MDIVFASIYREISCGRMMRLIFFPKSKTRSFGSSALAQSRMFAKDRVRRKPWKTKCWSSPNANSNGVVYITCFGIGLHALRSGDGSVLWTYDLGVPRNHLSGVALNEEENIFVASQRNYLHSVSPDGSRRWSVKVRSGYDSWGNPSVDREAGTVYFPLSRQETNGFIVAIDYEGKVRWTRDIPGGIRGSVAISRLDYVLVGGLDGQLYFIKKDNGEVVRHIELTKVQRGLWTTPSIDRHDHILLTTKDSRISGSFYCLDSTGTILWRYELGKAAFYSRFG